MLTLDEIFQREVNKPTYQLVADAKVYLATVANYFYSIRQQEDYARK